MTSAATLGLAWASLALLLAGTAAVVVPLIRSTRPAFRARGRLVRLATLASAAVAAVLLLRPHEDTFSGLDASGYRHMAATFRDGRGLHDTDETLLIPPLELREAFLLLPNMNYRNTRDRSFQILSLQRAETEPFFYPLVSLAASAFDRLIPGARDYLLPALHAILIACVLIFSASRGGGVGLALAVALLAVTPFPAWFLRGYFPEALGALLVSLVALQEPMSRRERMAQSFALGVSISLHPLLVMMAGPVFGIRWLSTRFAWSSLAGLILGALPLYSMTRWICKPYGDIFSTEVLRFNMAVSGEHRTVMGFSIAAGLALLAAGVVFRIRSRFERADSRNAPPPWPNPRVLDSTKWRLLLAVFALAPFAVMVLHSEMRPVVLRGAGEAWTGVRVPGVLLLGIFIAILLANAPLRVRWPIAIAIAILPVCFYLKGAEVPGLWHQRRLLPGFLMLIVALVPASASLDLFVSRARVPIRAAIALLLLGVGCANAARWPALYVVRNEAGAQAWIDRVANTLGKDLTFFDYHPFSFPLAVDLRRPVLGLGEYAGAFLPSVIEWLSAVARERTVRIATAYENPGIESGLLLMPGPVISAQVARIRSRALFPAETFARSVSVQILEMRPADERTPELRKVFDGGPLALRGSWIKRIQPIRKNTGESVPAQWFRNGASVIGPAAGAGEVVRVRIQGVAGQRDRSARQRIEIRSPDGDVLGEFELAHEWTDLELELPGSGSPSARTMTYTLRTPTPYNPAREGLRGYHPDLGALVHRIDMTVVPAHTAAHE